MEKQDSTHQPSASQLLAALTEAQHEQLRAFAARRLKRLGGATAWQRLLASLSPEDIVNRAVEKVLLGDRTPEQGRFVSSHHRINTETFASFLTGVINSELSHLISSMEAATEHVPVSTSDEPIKDEVQLVDQRNPQTNLELRDLKVVLFRELRHMAERNLNLLPIIDAWESSFLEDRRMPTTGFDRRQVWLVRSMARQILARLAKEVQPNAPSGLEMLM